MDPAPLVVGFPGGMELLVIVLVAILVFGPLVTVAVLGYGYLTREERADEEREARLAALESEVENLRARLDDEE